MAAFRRLAETSLFASIRSSRQEATSMPSNHIARRGYHIELGAREKALLEEDPALKRFKSYKNNLKRVSRIGDALTIAVVVVIEGLKKELERWRGERFVHAFEEFIPIRTKCDEEIGAKNDTDCKEKMSWMTSAQL